MKFTFTFLFLLVSFAHATRTERPYRIVIITDETSQARANAFMTYLRSQPPFSQMSSQGLQISITQAPTRRMNCNSPYTRNIIEQRLVTCDQNELEDILEQQNAHFAVAITSFPPYYGGSGGPGSIPVGTLQLPDDQLLHEMLHTYGIEDEYSYPEDEAPRICTPGRTGPNMAFFRDVPPYASDSAARVTHNRHVPWMGRIPAAMPITQLPSLGSPARTIVRGSQQIGLYRGGNCPDAPNGAKSWRPYESSIMNGDTDDFVYPIYADVVTANIRRSIGRAPVLATRRNTPRRQTEVSIEGAPAAPAESTSGSTTVSEE